MKIKKIAQVVLLTTTIAQAYATPVGMKAHCPTVQDLWVSSTSDFKHTDDYYTWTVKQIAQFGTQQQWTFYLGGFHGTDLESAIKSANVAISTLTLSNAQPVRVYPTSDPLWVCFYEGKDLVAWTETSDFAR